MTEETDSELGNSASRVREVRGEDAFDVAAVHRWLTGHVAWLGELSEVPRVRQFAGGASNLTYLLSYGDGDLVLRRPPHGDRAVSAHDMRREVMVQQGLRPFLDVVAHVYGFCEDTSVIGTQFYVMEYLRGTILGAELPPGVDLDARQARRLGETVIDALADLHSVDIAKAGLDRLSKGPGYVRRQVEGWAQRWRGALTDDVPAGEAVVAWLVDRQPNDVAARMLHGDWKLDNLVLDLDDEPHIVGVLDWEMATVGDPLMDLGAAMAYWITADDDPFYRLLRRQPTHLPGMPSREQAVSRYLERTGLTAADWGFYEVFGLFRLAVIIQQIWARYRAGQTTNPAFQHFGAAVTVAINRAGDLLSTRWS